MIDLNFLCNIFSISSLNHIGPVILDCEMEISCAQWNHDGSILASGGSFQTKEEEVSVVQFFNPWGLVREKWGKKKIILVISFNILISLFILKHLKTLKLPSNRIRAIAWEGNSLRMVIASDSYIYFANMRTNYKVSFFFS